MFKKAICDQITEETNKNCPWLDLQTTGYRLTSKYVKKKEGGLRYHHISDDLPNEVTDIQWLTDLPIVLQMTLTGQNHSEY